MAKKKYKIKQRITKARSEVEQAAKPKPKKPSATDLPFTKRNYLIFVIGLLVIILGFIALSAKDITISPILLILGYCVLIPLAILYSGRKQTEAENKPAEQISGD